MGLLFSLLTVISALAFFGLVVLLHFLPNKFNLITNTVSDYTAMLSHKHKFITTATTIFGSLATLNLAVAIITKVTTPSIYVILLLVVASICRLFIIFFPTDITGQPVTKTGRIHLILAITVFTTIAFAASNFYITNFDKIIGQSVALTATIFLVGFLPQLKNIFGLLERIFIFSSIVWLVIVGYELFLMV